MTRPELLRSWASDAIGSLPSRLRLARARADLAARARRRGVGRGAARGDAGAARAALTRRAAWRVTSRCWIAAAFSATMGDAILALYRAARQPVMAELGEGLAPPRSDRASSCWRRRTTPSAPSAQRREVAATAGAGVAVVEGGHWWLTEPAAAGEGAAALRAFWATSDLLDRRERAVEPLADLGAERVEVDGLAAPAAAAARSRAAGRRSRSAAAAGVDVARGSCRPRCPRRPPPRRGRGRTRRGPRRPRAGPAPRRRSPRSTAAGTRVRPARRRAAPPGRR